MSLSDKIILIPSIFSRNNISCVIITQRKGKFRFEKMNKVFFGDNLSILENIPANSISLIYIDPPFNLGRKQQRQRSIKGEKLDESKYFYNDDFEDFEDFLMKRIERALPLLKPNGSLFIHLNYKEVHYIKVAVDTLMGRDKFMNEIIYTWDYGAKSKKKWSTKHDTILWYAQNPHNYIFNYDAIDRIPYKAPELVMRTSKNAEEKIKNGKLPNTVWDLGIVHTLSKENTKYPTQKPLKLLERIIKVHSNEGDTVMDFFAGSGSFGEAAIRNKRNFILIDSNQDAIQVMKKRFNNNNVDFIIPFSSLGGK